MNAHKKQLSVTFFFYWGAGVRQVGEQFISDGITITNSLYTTILVEREDFEVGEQFIFDGITIMNSLYITILVEREDYETVNV